MTSFNVPSLSKIQRTNMFLVAVLGTALLILRSPAASLACVLGGGIVILNLFLLGLMGRLLLVGAVGGASAALRATAIPFKLLLLVLLVYLVFTQTSVDPIGFSLGVLSQLVAVLIETALAGRRARECETSVEGSTV